MDQLGLFDQWISLVNWVSYVRSVESVGSVWLVGSVGLVVLVGSVELVGLVGSFGSVGLVGLVGSVGLVRSFGSVGLVVLPCEQRSLILPRRTKRKRDLCELPLNLLMLPPSRNLDVPVWFKTGLTAL